MLAQRIITALILAPIVVFGTLFLSSFWFSLVVGIMVIIASWEYCGLIKLSLFLNKAFYIIVILVCAFLLAISPSILKAALYFTLAWWIIAFFIVVSHPKNSNLLNRNKGIGPVSYTHLTLPTKA